MHRRPNVMERVDPDEVKLAEVSKHPIGIILLYIQAGLGMTVAIGLSYFLLPLVVDDTDTAFFIGNVFAGVSVLLAFVVILIATYIYKQNRVIITDRNITQVLQFGLFNRKVSQLNVNNVEDVTALQDGVLPTFFNYGTLKIETAGEQVNFNFTFCPNAGFYAKIILDAREKMLGQMHPDHNNVSAMPEVTKFQKGSKEAIKDLGAETVKASSRN